MRAKRTLTAALLGAATMAALAWSGTATDDVAPTESRPGAERRVAATVRRRAVRDRSGAISAPEPSETSAPTGVVVVGRVVDVDGAPVVGAGILGPRSSLHCWDSYAYGAETDADGRFEVRRGTYSPRGSVLSHDICSRVRAEGFLDGRHKGTADDWSALTQGGRIDAGTIVLRRSAGVAGVVRELDGSPAPWAELTWWVAGHDNRGELGAKSVHSDRDGRFEIDELDPKSRWRMAASSRRASSDVASLASVLRGGAVAHLDLVLSELPADGERPQGRWSLSGIVVDDAGHPVAGAEVGGANFSRGPGNGYDVATSADGRFAGVVSHWWDESGLPVEFDVEHDEYAVARIVLTDEQHAHLARHGALDDLRVTLREPARVRGRVLDPSGKPVAGADVRVTDVHSGDRNPSSILRTHTDKTGTFELSRLDSDAEWWMLADDDLETSHYVPLSGRLRRGETVTIDIAFPPIDPTVEVELEVSIRGWQAGMSVMLDCIGHGADGPVLRTAAEVGPHRLTLYDDERHPVAFANIDVPYDAKVWRVVMDASGCADCTTPAHCQTPSTTSDGR